MSVSTRKEIKDNVLETTQQDDSQIGTLVEEFINLTLREIETPGWAFYPRREINHRWSFLKRKTTFDTVASTEDYVLERDIKYIAVLRQTTSPVKLSRMTDENFYEIEPNPTATGNPTIYRLWELSGVDTQLGTADTIDIVSSSTSDAGDSEMTVTVWGYDTNGVLRSETYTLNGTTAVSGTITYAARDIYVAKSKDTTGTITVAENSGSTTLTTIGPKERAPMHKVASLYPIPSSAMTMYLDYYSPMRELNGDGETPSFDSNWHYVVRLGTLAKVYQHLGGDKETSFVNTHNMYAAGVRAMVDADMGRSDLMTKLRRHNPILRYNQFVRRTTDDVT